MSFPTNSHNSFAGNTLLLAALASAALLPGCGPQDARDDSGMMPDAMAPDAPQADVPPVDVATTVPAGYWPHGVDLGVAHPANSFRALVVFPLWNEQEFRSRISSMYDPSSPQFRKYLSTEQVMARYGQPQDDLQSVQSWIESHGMKVERIAHNQLMLEYSGTVAQWNAAFGASLHTIQRSAGTDRNPAYAPVVDLAVPAPLVGRIRRLLMPDQAVPAGPLPPDTSPIKTTPPPDDSELTPAQIARAYGLSDLYAQGFRGAGMTLGVVGGNTFRNSDLQSMWQALGIRRSSAVVYNTMEPPQVRDAEPTSNAELAGAMAPDAKLIYYGGPDNSETTLVYTLNEAVGLAEAQVLSDSFAHAEYNSPQAVSIANDQTAMVAAALGITIVAAAGDSNQVDTPSNSPFVTAVGGTRVIFDGAGNWKNEESWAKGGCGSSSIFPPPSFQRGMVSAAHRTVPDVGVNTGLYWTIYQGKWDDADGTSSATPVFAGLLTVVNQYRSAHGKAPLGDLNPLIYDAAIARSVFRDVTQAEHGKCIVGAGYDMATGLGSPKAMAMATIIP